MICDDCLYQYNCNKEGVNKNDFCTSYKPIPEGFMKTSEVKLKLKRICDDFNGGITTVFSFYKEVKDYGEKVGGEEDG